MQRRDFLRSALIGSMLYGLGTIPRIGSVAQAAAFPGLGRRLLINVQLEGGPDLRYLFPPAFDSDALSIGYRYWQAMAGAHGIDSGDSGRPFAGIDRSQKPFTVRAYSEAG